MPKCKTQSECNPFLYSDTNKRYYTYDYYLRKTYGGKCVKIPLDAGFSCPNRENGGTGCIYCSSRGSGDFTESASLSVFEQYCRLREKMSKKWEIDRCIPYLQAYTNTYAPVDTLRRIYGEVLSLPDAVAFHIATRADCLPSEVLTLLSEVSLSIPLTVELGLQTANDKTAEKIGRGHDFATFLSGFYALRERVPKARIAVHLINGLPNEDREMMLSTAKALSPLCPDEVKIHLLYVLRGTPLAKLYEAGAYTPLSRDEYIETVVRQLELLPPETVVARLTGDGDETDLLAPLWSKKKVTVLNDIDKLMYERNTYQGRLYTK